MKTVSFTVDRFLDLENLYKAALSAKAPPQAMVTCENSEITVEWKSDEDWEDFGEG